MGVKVMAPLSPICVRLVLWCLGAGRSVLEGI